MRELKILSSGFVLSVAVVGVLVVPGCGGDESADSAAMTVTEYVDTDISTDTTAVAGGETYSGAGTSSDAEVLRVVDGDTIEVQLASGTVEDIRYIGINTPETVDPSEPVQCFGPAASKANENLVEGKDVRLVYDEERRDQYDRLLAYVYVGDLFVNARLVRDGFAYESYYSPNGAHRGLFERLESRASSRNIGLWGRC